MDKTRNPKQAAKRQDGMNVQLHLPPGLMRKLERAAAAKGVSPEEMARDLVCAELVKELKRLKAAECEQ